MSKAPKSPPADNTPEPTPAASAVLAPAAPALPVAMADFSSDLSLAAPDFKVEDVALPFLNVAQALTPQTKKHEAAYIPGLSEGDVFNTVTGAKYDGSKGVLVVPVGFTRSYTEWKPRGQQSDGAKLVKDHGTDDTAFKTATMGDKGMVLPNGNTIRQAARYFVLVLGPDGTDAPTQAVFDLAGTQLKKARRWNSLIGAQALKLESGGTTRVPMFFNAYRISTLPESNAKGSWMGVKMELAQRLVDVMGAVLEGSPLPGGADVYTMARQFAEMFKAGQVKVAPPEGTETHAPAEGEAVEDLPF